MHVVWGESGLSLLRVKRQLALAFPVFGNVVRNTPLHWLEGAFGSSMVLSSSLHLSSPRKLAVHQSLFAYVSLFFLFSAASFGS